MSGASYLTIFQLASVWEDQLRTDRSFTPSDVEELKGHLLEISENLIEKGLSEEEAFAVAIHRLGDLSTLRDEFAEINLPAIQLRKTTLVLSGVLAFFLLYYFIFTTSHFMVLMISHFSDDYVLNFRLVVAYMLIFPLLITISTAILHFSNGEKIKLLKKINIRPKHTFLLFLGILILSLTAEWARGLCAVKFSPSSYINHHLYDLLIYLNYFLPFVLIVSFIIIYKKYSQKIFGEEKDLDRQINGIDNLMEIAGDPTSINEINLQQEALVSIGLSLEEAQKILNLRLKVPSIKIVNSIFPNHAKGPNYDLLLVFSSVLAYYFFHYLLRSTCMILIFVMQHYENDPVITRNRLLSFALSFQCIFVLFTATLYFLDKNIVQRMKQLHVKPVHTILMFLATIFFAFLELLFLPLAKNSLGNDMAIKYEIMNIVHFSDYSFPFILGVCFLLLFNKYYRDNIKTN